MIRVSVSLGTEDVLHLSHMDDPLTIATMLCWHTGYTIANSGRYFTPLRVSVPTLPVHLHTTHRTAV